HDVDFNIHPAKREARFSDISSIHHGISSTVRNFYKNYTIQGLASKALNINTYSFIGEQQVKKTDQKELFDNLFTNTKKSNDSEENKTDNFFRTSYKIPSHQVSSSLGISDIKTDPQKENSVSLPKSENQSSQRISRFDLFKNKINVPSFGNKDSSITNIQSNNFDSERKNSALQKLSEEALDLNKSVSDENSDYKFLGCTLGTFLVAEKNGSLFIIDQHAAHERMIFNKIMNEKPNKISLIIPYILETESEGDNNYLESIKLNLSECGFDIQKSGKNTWEITTTPDRWKGTEKDLRDAILSKRLEPNEIIRSIAAMTACRSSVMDGYVLDEITASEIAREALKLEDPHCPHGRPIYTELSREKLFMLVKRT
ncbi:MAG: hypothetical protein HUK25_08030, partial [Treponema sp.]|nr:hypothetical protein [Treponema sp.]